MSIFNRIKNILAKPEPPKAERNILQLGPGDAVEVSLVTYQITGRTNNRQRNAVVLTLQDGNTIRYLHIEEREQVVYALYEPIDGRLDEPDEVPTTIEMEDRTYYMEEQYSGNVLVTGKTPFMQAGEQYVWQYQSDDYKLLRIEWQNGRFMLYEGDKVISGDVQVLRGT
ncbi:DUF4178 domain-containing protein [Paenibacillus sp. GCM10027629]|uniref:DUF4178 domain-containing protein n=1 Tax=Paenibacillus sp. GCM10027629 TaxID=3273414 RepID=UPI00363AEBF7